MAASTRSRSDKDGFRNEMIGYIKHHFADLLGSHIDLLDQDGGLDELADLVRRGKIG